MKKIYISGPVTGLPGENREAFEAAAAILEGHGFNPYIPHNHVKPGSTWEEAMRDCIRVMMDADAVFTLDGCDDSSGAAIEIELAGKIGIPVFESLSDMQAYYHARSHL
jgi:nucleoside 2-deoxyribosyltransferase